MTLLMRDRENIEKGIEQGIEQGIERGQKLLAELIKHLIADNRMGDIQVAVSNENVRNQLYEEYGLKN